MFFEIAIPEPCREAKSQRRMNGLRAIAASSLKKGGENSSVVGGEFGREVMGVRAYGKERGRDAGKMDLVNTHIRKILHLRQHNEFSGAVVSASLPPSLHPYLTLAKDTYLHTKPPMKPHKKPHKKPHPKPHTKPHDTYTYTYTSTYTPFP